MNKFRNEMNIKLGTQEILLRPDFANIAAIESNVGGLAYLAWKFSRASRKGQGIHEMVKAMPQLTECAAIIFYAQANVQADGKKQFNLEEVWEFVQAEGMKGVIESITIFLAKITAGATKVDEIESKATKTEADAEKKS